MFRILFVTKISREKCLKCVADTDDTEEEKNVRLSRRYSSHHPLNFLLSIHHVRIDRNNVFSSLDSLESPTTRRIVRIPIERRPRNRKRNHDCAKTRRNRGSRFNRLVINVAKSRRSFERAARRICANRRHPGCVVTRSVVGRLCRCNNRLFFSSLDGFVRALSVRTFCRLNRYYEQRGVSCCLRVRFERSNSAERM